MSARVYTLLVGGLLLAGCSSTPEKPAGNESRTLAAAEVEGLLQGRGMGMAAVAEMNGYPGPAHVLELKEELQLTPDQRFATSRLLGLMQGQVRALGQRIVEAEQQLDAAMSEGRLSREQVRQHIQNIASLRSQLRYTHIDAHLQQQKILKPEQIARYYELRGRKVLHVPAPVAPAPVTEPIRLPAEDGASMQDAPAAPVDSDSSSAPAVPAAGLPAEAPLPQPSPAEDFETEAVETEPPPALEKPAPALPLPAAPATKPEQLTPGMRDALDAGPAEMPVSEPAPATETAAPLPPPTTEQTRTEEPPPEKTEPSPPLPQPAVPATKPEQLTPGMQDALDAGPAAQPEDDEPAENEEPPPPPLTPSAKTSSPHRPAGTAPTANRKDPATPVIQESGKLTPGMRDAMEFAEPRDENAEDEEIRIEPLETAEEPPELPSSEPVEPVMIELDN